MSRRPAPVWFQVLVVAAVALAFRVLDDAPRLAAGGGDELSPPALAFWPIILTVASIIWKGVQIAGQVTLAALQWSVVTLWTFARSIYNGALAIGKGVVWGFQKSWDFMRATFENVLKPAWEKFWHWFERAKKWLEDTFGPALRFLDSVRKWISDFYDDYIRPVLDSIGIARRVLRILQSLGADWAKALDAKLSELERRIDQPFRLVLREINRIIGIIDRIVTLDGLIQRVALIRSIERDVRQVRRAIVNWGSLPLTDEDFAELRELARGKPERQRIDEFNALVARGEGPRAALVSELVASLRNQLSASP
jgi:hypothetical protein